MATPLRRSQKANRDNLLIALITLLLVWVNRQVSVETSVDRNANDRGRGYLQAFTHSLKARFRDHLTIEQYAVDVGISAAYLNALCRKLGGQSALQMINERLVLAARHTSCYPPQELASKNDSLRLGRSSSSAMGKLPMHRTSGMNRVP